MTKMVKRMINKGDSVKLGDIEIYKFSLPKFAQGLNQAHRFGEYSTTQFSYEFDRDTRVFTVTTTISGTSIQMTEVYGEYLIEKYLA